MKLTIFLLPRLGSKLTGRANPLAFVALCGILALMPNTSVLYAQTMAHLGPTLSNEVIDLINAEIAFLEYEVQDDQTPPPGVSAGKNALLAQNYVAVIDGFGNGLDLKVAFTHVARLLAGFSTQVPDRNPVGSNLLKSIPSAPPGSLRLMDYGSPAWQHYHTLIENMNIVNGNLTDLQAVLNYLRTLKNQ